MASSSSAELTRSYSTTRGGILNSTRARPGLRPIALSTPANGSLRMPNPAKDQKREEKVLAKWPEICLGLPQAREVKTWRPTCRRSRVTKRRGAKARRQCLGSKVRECFVFAGSLHYVHLPKMDVV